jgi:hypothetical protein
MALVLMLNKGLTEEVEEVDLGRTFDEATVGLPAPSLEPSTTSCLALTEFES